MNQAKLNILSRLKRAKGFKAPEREGLPSSHRSRSGIVQAEDLLRQLISKLEENHAEVHRVSALKWKTTLTDIMEREKAKHCLLGNNLAYQSEIEQALRLHNNNISITRYSQAYETLRETLFHNIDIGITLAQGAIAETGTLLLLPNKDEPRMMSLVPPIHLVLLQEDQIYPDLSSLLNDEPWGQCEKMPSNVLFISSPSKTADIQQTLAYGAHGPKKLIVLVQENAEI